jgi:putative DNA primase/helicase
MLLRPKGQEAVCEATAGPLEPPATEWEQAYARAALADAVAKLRTMRKGEQRNIALNNAAFALSQMEGWIDLSEIAASLFQAAIDSGYVAQDGERAAKETIESGINAGRKQPRSRLSTDNSIVQPMIEAHKAKQAAANAQSSGKRSVTLIQGSEIRERPVTWLWDQYLPLGKLTLLAGAGGTGKSTIAFNLAGTVTTGGTWPDGSRCRNAGNVLIWSSEDDPADTIKPRLMAVGADEHRYGIIAATIDEKGISYPFDAARDMDALREAVKSIGGLSLLIIDPVVSAVTGDMNKSNEVRRSLQTIVDFAAEMNCAVLGITHFAKGTAGRDSAERVIGSTAFKDFSRMTLVAAKDEESNRRVFTRAKSNNSADTGGYSYSIEVIALHSGITATRVVWGEPLQGSSRAILAGVESEPSEESSKLEIAKRFLIDQLQRGPLASKELFEHAREGYGVSTNTLRRAQKDLGIVATKAAFVGGWMWALPIANPSQSSL